MYADLFLFALAAVSPLTCAAWLGERLKRLRAERRAEARGWARVTERVGRSETWDELSDEEKARLRTWRRG